MIWERLLILGIVSGVALVGYGGWRLWLAKRTLRLARQTLPSAVAQHLPAGPALLYFTTPTCAQCRLQQTPILKQLAQTTGVTIHTIDAVEQDAVAQHFGILTVPTTIWLDQTQRPAAVNHGLAPLVQLRHQAAALNL
jgi:thioredoxin-like negative regulator of GroEL